MTELSQTVDHETGTAMLKDPDKRSPLERQLAALSNRMYTKKLNRLPNYLQGNPKHNTKYCNKSSARLTNSSQPRYRWLWL